MQGDLESLPEIALFWDIGISQMLGSLRCSQKNGDESAWKGERRRHKQQEDSRLSRFQA